MIPAEARRGVLDSIERMLNRGEEADELLRRAVDMLHERLGYRRVAISFVEADRLAAGPTAGSEPGSAPSLSIPIQYAGCVVGELAVDPADEAPTTAEERAFLERVATLISAHTLVAWDTGGAAWEP